MVSFEMFRVVMSRADRRRASGRLAASWIFRAVRMGAGAIGVLAGLTLAGAGRASEGGQAASGVAASDGVRYDRDIRPILSDRCFQCHGPDGNKRQADLRLDERASATADRRGRVAAAPGDPEGSELWRRINASDPDDVMPPPDSNKRPLSSKEKDLIRRWIVEGVAYEPHWSFIPPSRPDAPAVADED